MLQLDDLLQTVVDARYKGIPLGARLRVDEIGRRGWNVAAGDLALPTTTLSISALDHNIAVMAEYCARNGAALAPHGKTTMAPQLFDRQLRAGAWGITAATPAQMATMRAYGVERIILANELVEAGAIRWVAAESDADEDCEIISLVDSPATVRRIEAILQECGARRPLPVLIEVGVPGGRAGVRDVDAAMAVARAVQQAAHLRLVGVETYEGLAAGGASADDLAAVDRLLRLVRDVVDRLDADGLFETDRIVVTAGGSAYFDRVVEVLSWPEDERRLLVLRSGCYVSHDLGRYQAISPLDGRAGSAEPLSLRNALVGWGAVLSRPEPGLVIVGAGKRDLPHDLAPPAPLRAYRPGRGSPAEPVALAGRARTARMMDQHLFLELGEDVPLEPGDIVAFGLSHPCTAFDKMRLLPLVDDDLQVVDAILTAF